MPVWLTARQTDWSDYPPEKAALFMRTPVWCRKRASELGSDVAELINDLMTINALHRLRGPIWWVRTFVDVDEVVALRSPCSAYIDLDLTVELLGARDAFMVVPISCAWHEMNMAALAWELGHPPYTPRRWTLDTLDGRGRLFLHETQVGIAHYVDTETDAVNMLDRQIAALRADQPGAGCDQYIFVRRAPHPHRRSGRYRRASSPPPPRAS